jgi:phosphofructokinase-like protein
MRIGILTGGGDCPGLNAVIRAVVRKAERDFGDEIVGFLDGWQGVLDDRWVPLDIESCRGLLPRGGTVLGTSRVQPYMFPDGVDRVRERLAEHRIDAMVVIGGEGSLSAAAELSSDGFAIVGVPKTIDNDIVGTQMTFGFQTAVEIATDAIDRLHTTAESHHRVMVVEVMGRHAGHIAAWAGLAGGATITLVPEEPFDIDQVCDAIRKRHAGNRFASVVVVAEGATPIEGTLEVDRGERDEFGHLRLGGIGAVVAHEIEKRTGIESRITILGHVQRGGTPSAFDRVLCSWLGVAAVEAIHDGAFGHMVALTDTGMARVPLSAVKGRVKPVDPAFLRAARVFFA